MITHIVSDWLFSPCCVEHQDEFIFERVAVAYSRDYNEVGRAQIKTKIYNTNLDLVTDNVYTNFGLILSIRSQDIEQKTNFDVNQGPLLCCQFVKNNDLQYQSRSCQC